MSQVSRFSRPETLAPSSRPGVLVAVADAVRRAELAVFLAAEGVVVWPAETGLEALSTFFGRTGEIDVLLLDADLPDLPRSAFLRRLRPHFPGVPCVFLVDLCPASGSAGEATWAVDRREGPAAVARAVCEAIAFDPELLLPGV